MTKGRIEEAKKLLQKAAATNKRSLPPGLLEQVLGGSCPQTLPWALQQPLELSSPHKHLSIPTGDGLAVDYGGLQLQLSYTGTRSGKRPSFC